MKFWMIKTYMEVYPAITLDPIKGYFIAYFFPKKPHIQPSLSMSENSKIVKEYPPAIYSCPMVAEKNDLMRELTKEEFEIEIIKMRLK